MYVIHGGRGDFLAIVELFLAHFFVFLQITNKVRPNQFLIASAAAVIFETSMKCR